MSPKRMLRRHASLMLIEKGRAINKTLAGIDWRRQKPERLSREITF